MPHCPVCANEEDLKLVETSDQFSIYACPVCEVQFSDPLSYSTGFYDNLYSSGGLSLLRIQRMDRRAMVTRSRRMLGAPQRLTLRWLKTNLAPGSPVLEVGFGGGWFLSGLEREGYQALGVEVAKNPVELLRQKGFTVSQSTVDDLPREWPAPRAIVLFEVVEHVPDPVGFLQGLHDRFPQAPLLLSTPSAKRWSLHLGHREAHDYPPYHLTRWTEKALTEALLRAGYAEARCLFPRPDPAEVYSTVLAAILNRLHLFSLRESRQQVQDGGRRSRRRSLFTRVAGQFPGLTLLIYDAGLGLSRILFLPVTWWFSAKRWSSSSMLAVGTPAASLGYKELGS